MHMQHLSANYNEPLMNGARRSVGPSMHSAYAFQEGTGGRTHRDSVTARNDEERFFLFRTTRYCFIYWGILSILLSPIAGLLLMIAAVRERTMRTFSVNPSDWLVLFFIGLMLQGTVAAPAAYLFSSRAHYEMVHVLHAEGEYYSAFVFPFALGVHTMATIFLFIYYHNQYQDDNGLSDNGGFGVAATPQFPYRQQHTNAHQNNNNSQNRPTTTEAQKAVDMRNARIIKNEIELSTRQKTEYIIPVAFAIGVFEVVLTRICYFSANHQCGNRFIMFEVPLYADNDFYTLATINFMFLFVAFNSSNFFALMLYYQKLMQVREFRYVGTRGENTGNGKNVNLDSARQRAAGANGTRRGGYTAVQQEDEHDRHRGGGGGGGGLSNNLANPEHNSTWTLTWRQIVVDMKRRPEIRAATNSTFPVLLFVILVAITYICIYNMTGEGMAAFTTGFVCLIATCTFVVLGFVYVTVQMADAVDYQTKVIAKQQNDMQVRLDEEGPDMDLFHRQLLMAKVRLLQSLDVYLRHSSSKPKLIGLSMESFRWTIIIIGLFMMNVFFFSLHYTHCGGSSAKHPAPSTVLNSTLAADVTTH